MKKILLLILSLSINFVYSKDLQFYNIDGTEIITKETEGLTIKKFQEIYFPQYKFL